MQKLFYLQDDLHREYYKRFYEERDLLNLHANMNVLKNVSIKMNKNQINLPLNVYLSKVDQAMG